MAEFIRGLLAKPTHDGHDRGVRYIARKFRDAGFEVIFSPSCWPMKSSPPRLKKTST